MLSFNEFILEKNKEDDLEVNKLLDEIEQSPDKYTFEIRKIRLKNFTIPIYSWTIRDRGHNDMKYWNEFRNKFFSYKGKNYDISNSTLKRFKKIIKDNDPNEYKIDRRREEEINKSFSKDDEDIGAVNALAKGALSVFGIEDIFGFDEDEIHESRRTPDVILDKFEDRIGSYDIDNDFKLSIERTRGSYKVIIVNKETNKTVGRIYIQNIREKDGKYSAELRRLHVNDEFRNRGFGELLLKTAINRFKDLELYGYASPNRNKDMAQEDREIYRKRLLSFYDKVGLKRVSDKNFKVLRKADESFTNI